jgi:hypothetical protein
VAEYDSAVDYELALLSAGEEHRPPVDIERVRFNLEVLQVAADHGSKPAQQKLARLNEILEKVRKRQEWANELRNRHRV